MDGLLGDGLQLAHHLLVLVLDHLVLGLLSPKSSFYICGSHLDRVFGDAVGLVQLILLKILDLNADLTLGLDVLDVSLLHLDGQVFV